MSNMTHDLATGRQQTRLTNSIELGPRDVADALRLLNLLLNSTARDRIQNGVNDVRAPAIEARSGGFADLRTIADGVLRLRRERAQFFAPSMFGEAPWDMLLVLSANDRSESRLTTTRLATLSGAPLTTALRWLDYLEQAGLVRKRESPTDRRITFVELTDQGRTAMERYLMHVSTSWTT